MEEEITPFEPVNLARATNISGEQLADVMDYHPWDQPKIEKGTRVRVAIGEAIRAVIENVPPSADRTTAIRKLREARMDANSAITHGGNY